MVSEILLISSSSILGVFLGAQIAEAYLLVPYWKALPADEFFELHKVYGSKIHQFFAPLTITATLLPLITVVYGIANHFHDPLLLGLMGISTIAFFSTYFLYFEKANNSFVDRALCDEELSLELDRWGAWHWGRIFFELIAFVCALVLLADF